MKKTGKMGRGDAHMARRHGFLRRLCGSRIKKRWKALAMAALFSFSSVLAGCGGAGASGDASANSKDVLYIFNWAEYIPPEVYELFEKETGIHVVESTYSSNEEMLAKLIAGKGGQYDLAVASNYVINAMKQQDLIQPIGIDQVTNLSNLDERVLDQDYDPGNIYTVPYMSTVTVIAENTDMAGRLGVSIDSFNDLTNPKLKNNIVAVDDSREIVGIAMKAMGLNPDSTDADTIRSSSTWLKELRPNIKLYDSDTAYAAMVTEEAAVGIIYNLDLHEAMAENDKIQVVQTKEPAAMSIDSFVLCKGSRHQKEAQEFINFILRPDIYKMCLEEFPALCLNKETLPLLSEEERSQPVFTLDDPIVQNSKLIEDVGDAAEYYDEVFSEMKM